MSVRPDLPGTPVERARVTVIGGGKMGRGIAVSFLSQHHPVTLVEVDVAALSSALDAIREDTARRAPDGQVASALTGSTDISETEPAQLVVESVPEHLALKQRVLATAEQSVVPGGLLVSNTSSLSIDELAGAVQRPDRFLGMHFFQPVPDTNLVELVTGEKSSAEAVQQARGWVLDVLGREPITVRDTPGFATSRLGIAIGLEAMRMVEEGVANAEDIDLGMRLGYQHAVGPLRMSDMVGLDVRLAIAEHLAAELGPRFEPPRILREKVAAGELGQKSGRGFFDWS